MDSGEIRLAIACPIVSDTVPKGFWISWTMMISELLTNEIGFKFLVPKMVHGEFQRDIAKVRNSLVYEALDDDCTHILMCDSDQIYPSDTILKLLSHNRDIVAAKVHRRYPPFDPILYKGSLGKYQYIEDEKWKSGELIEVDNIGTGCILYKTKVFYDVDAPWYDLPESEDGRPIGEDIYFHHKLKEKGFQIFVDTSIIIGHLSSIVIDENLYDLFKMVRKE